LASHAKGHSRHNQRCSTCQMVRSNSLPQELYTLFLVPQWPWLHVSIVFVLGLACMQHNKVSILVMVDRFTKMAHLIACHKMSSASYIADVYFKKVVRHHGIPFSFILSHDSKFLSYFLSHCRIN